MRTRLAPARFVAGAALLTLSAISQAHHPILAKFDDGNELTLQGKVTAVDWSNPHVHVFMNVTDQSGAVVNWAVELESPIELDWSGWTPEMLPAGTMITVEGFAALNGTHQVWGNSVTTASGETLFTVPADVLERQLGDRPDGPTPRWPDNQPRLGSPPGQTGYFMMPSKSSLVEDGVEVEIDANGQLANIADAERVAPFQTWAKDLYVLRQSNHLKDDPSFLYCIPPGGPRHFQLPYGVQFVENRERQRLFVLMGGGNGNWRQIWTDGRDQVGQVTGDDTNPLFFGRAVAKWEGDTLVIDTKGFNETFWFSNGGLPHTNQLHLIERISRPDLNTLHYEVTVDDPGAYTRTWTSSWDLQWVPGKEMPEYYCQDNRP